MQQVRIALLALGWILIGGKVPAVAQADLAARRILSCDVFLSEALECDPEFNRSLQNYLQARYSLLSARAVSAWTLGAGAGTAHSESISGSAFEPRSVDVRTYDFSVQKLFLATGSRVSLTHGNALTESSFDFSGLATPGFDPGLFISLAPRASTPEFTLAVVQPLLQNAFGLADRYPLQAAELQARAAELDAREAWENRAADLYGGYLDWAGAYENLQAQQSIVDDLRRLETTVASQNRVGVAESAELLRTRENLLRARSQWVLARSEYAAQSARIAFLRVGKPAAPAEAAALRPHLETALDACVSGDNRAAAESGTLRLVRKLELLRQQLAGQAGVAENAQLPRLDFSGSCTFKGRAEEFTGGYNSLNRRDYAFRLQAEYPLGNAGARGELERARAGLAEVSYSLQAARRDLSYSLLQTSELLRGLREALALQEEQVQVAQAKLDADLRNFRLGRVDTFYVIESENGLTSAHLQHIQTLLRFQRLRIAFLALSDRLLEQFPELERRLRAGAEAAQ